MAKTGRSTVRMYNEELKQAFIDSIETDNNKKVARSVFTATAPYEESWGADFCTKSREDVLPVAEKISGIKIRGRYTRLRWLSRYSKWCIEHGVPGAVDNSLSVHDIGTDRIGDAFILNPVHLQRCLDEVFDPESERTVDNTYRCYFWLAYGGLPAERAVEITAGDVDLDNLEITKVDSTAILYRQGVDAVRNCIKLTQFRYKHPNYDAVWRDRVPGKQILRGIRGECTLYGIRMRVSKKIGSANASGQTKSRLSYQHVWMSGVFYRIFEQELAGLEINFIKIAADSPNGQRILAGAETKTPKSKKIEVLASDLRRDYKEWKKLIQA